MEKTNKELTQRIHELEGLIDTFMDKEEERTPEKIKENKKGHLCCEDPCSADHAEGDDACDGCHCKKNAVIAQRKAEEKERKEEVDVHLSQGNDEE